MYSLTTIRPTILHPRSSILGLPKLHHSNPLSRLSLHFVAQLLGNFLSNPIVGDLVKRDLSIRELAGGLERLNNLVDALMRRHAAAAHRLSVNPVSVFIYLPA